MKHFIHAERDSVCMGDDCLAPNPAELEYRRGETLSDFMDKAARYVPEMNDVVWSVRCADRTVGWLIFDHRGRYTCELAVPDMPVEQLPEKRIFCRYYYERRFRDYRVQPSVELYPELKSLLEKVKAWEKGS